MITTPGIVILIIAIAGIIYVVVSSARNKHSVRNRVSEIFPDSWKQILNERVWFYREMSDTDKNTFEKRLQLFLATKNIESVNSGIDDTVRLLVACSAVIPVFAFPEYNYPHVSSVLVYNNSFNEQYETQRYEGAKENIIGKVEGKYQNSTVILSKPDLLRAFDGLKHTENVGIHEFVHVLDKEDGVVDGIPEELLKHRYVAPWLREIKEQMRKIESGHSDINPYALTNNAEFLAVVSEYFFSNPEKMKNRHPELYKYLTIIFTTTKDL